MAEAHHEPTHTPSSGSETSGSPRKSPRRAWKESARMKAADFYSVPLPDIVGEVKEMTTRGRLWPSAKELVNTLHLKLPVASNSVIQELIVDQYHIAKRKKRIQWIREMWSYVSLNQNEAWMVGNLDFKPPKRKQSSAPLRSLIVKDCRLRENPGLPVVSVDLGCSHVKLLEEIKQEAETTTREQPLEEVKGEVEGPSKVCQELDQSVEVQQTLSGDLKMELDSDVEVQEAAPMDPIIISSEREEEKEIVGEKGERISPTPSVEKGRQEDLRERLNRARQRREERESRDRDRSHLRSEAEELPSTSAGEGGKRRSGKRTKNCPVAACSAVFRNTRRHVVQRHLPSLFGEEEMRDRRLDIHRMDLMGKLREQILGPQGTFSNLVHWVNGQGGIASEAFIPDTDKEWLTGVCEHYHWEVPSSFTLSPVNSRALLFYWRVLAMMLSSLTRRQRQQFARGELTVTNLGETSGLLVIDSVGFEEAPTADSSDVLPQETNLAAFDSHFHPDRLSKALFNHERGSIADLIGAEVGRPPEVSVTVAGGILVYCDPETYPKYLPSKTGFGIAVGIHPRKISELTEEKFQELSSLLRSLSVVALGEIGLDHTEPRHTWEEQERTLIRLLHYSMPIRPVVVHLRDKDDMHAGEVSAKCLTIFKGNAAPTQRVHLHCFAGTVEQVVAWLEVFPQCHFGFTGKVRSFDRFQVAALQRVPDNRLLLETDAPYFRPFPTARASTPAYIGEIAMVVSKLRGQPLDLVLKLTTGNAKALYGV